ncbi:uncharacterized protein METZ01_LOCUS319008, partial [marine metagenome]
KSRCTECNKFCQKGRRASAYCDEPCETWKGGIRFTQTYINLNGKNVDTLKTRKEIISSQEGIKNAEIFKSRSTIANEFGEKLAALVLYDEKFSRKSFKNFLEKRKYEEADLPEVVHYFEYDHYSDNPWSSRGISKTGAKSYRGSKLSDELYADLRSFIPTSKPSVKTIGYMRRRFRRLLRNFQTTDSDLYISLR